MSKTHRRFSQHTVVTYRFGHPENIPTAWCTNSPFLRYKAKNLVVTKNDPLEKLNTKANCMQL